VIERRGQETVPTGRLPVRPGGRPGGAYVPAPGTQATPSKPPGPGDVELGVLADLANIGEIPRGRVALKAMAIKLARTIDARGDDEAASALAKAVDTLRQVMNQLMAREVNDPNAFGTLSALLGAPDTGSPSVSPPLRYPPNPEPSDSRARNRPRRQSPGSQ
jgi:hypothetical protein